MDTHAHGGRVIEIGDPHCTVIQAIDQPDENSGANHDYEVLIKLDEGKTPSVLTGCEIHFQKGPVKETGRNGIHNEDLIAIVIDRLACLQKGKFPCEENFVAQHRLEEALESLNQRSRDRKARGVEGENKA